MGQKIIISEFLEGVDTDTDVLRIKKTKLRDSLNTVVVKVDGKSIVRSPIEGFTYEFSLSPNFVPIGCGQYNGILYLVSIDQTTGQGELGTYPSPINCAGGFQHVYKPLQNFTGNINPLVNPSAPRLNFRTDLFRFLCGNQVDVEIRDDYDGSVNIYMADFRNPLRGVNSGFDQRGVCNNRLYWNGSFPGGIETSGETCQYGQARITDIPISAGQVQAGNFWFHFRYTTADFNPTSFLAHTGPAQISPDQDNQGCLIDGRAGLTITSKAVQLHLTNLDTNYPFIEMAVVYFYNNVIDVALIDNQYAINPATGECDITYTGLENVVDGFDFDNLISTKIVDDIPRTICQIENQLWQGNLKSRAFMDQQLIDFVKLIKPKYDDSLQIEDKVFNATDSQDKYQHKDWRNTYNNTGYFRGEPYALAVVAVFNSGRKSKPIPMAGGDDFFNAIVYDNDKGIYRFPNSFASNPRTNLDTDGNGLLNILGIKFDTSACPPGFNDFINNEVCGFYFVRAKRKPMLLYQGLVLNCYNMAQWDFGYWFPNVFGCNNGLDEDTISSNYIPMWNNSNFGIFPYTIHEDPTIGPTTRRNFHSGTIGAHNQAGFSQKQSQKFGIYSCDHYFLKSIKDGLFNIIKVAEMTPVHDAESPSPLSLDIGPIGYRPAGIFETGQMKYFDPANNVNVGIGYLRNIAQWEVNPQAGFVSYFREGASGDTGGLVHVRFTCNIGGDEAILFNREMGSNHYIAADFTMAGTQTMNIDAEDNFTDTNPDGWSRFGRSIVNIYNRDPLTLTTAQLASYYDTDSEQYYEISDFIPKSQFFGVTGGTVFYRGDCFLQRTYHKQLYDPRYSQSGGDDGNTPLIFNTHAVLHSVVTENAINTAMRFEADSRKYYPETGLSNLVDIISTNTREAEGRNPGYDNTLPADFQFAVNLTTLLGTTNRFPTRIRFSAKHIHNSFTDGYKIVAPDAFKDFDYRMGEIVSLQAFNSRLVSIQESGMNIHIINERAAFQDQTGEDLLIGKGDVLSQKFQNITDQIGSQNQWSVIRTPMGLTGVDGFKRKIWFLKNDFSLDVISESQLYSTRINQVIDRHSIHSDLLHKIADSPVCGEGIVTGYDFKTGNVFYTFILLDGTSNLKPTPLFKVTHCFNEKMWQWMGEMSFTPVMYPTINNDLFSFAPNRRDAWRHGRAVDATGNPNFLKFYGTNFKAKLKWIPNEAPELTKIFDNLNLSASGHTPARIRFATEDQNLAYDPFIQNNLAHDGVYRENQWKIPIGTALTVNSTPNNEYQIGSYMRGKYLDIEIEYETNQQFYLKSALLFNRISKI